MSDTVGTTPSEGAPELPKIPALNRLSSVNEIGSYSKIDWKNGGGKPIDADNLNHIDDGITSATEGVNKLSNYTKDVLLTYSEDLNSSITNIANYLKDYAEYIEGVIYDIDNRNGADESDLSEFKLTAMGAIAVSLSEAEAYAKNLVDALNGGTDQTVADLHNQITELSGTLETYKSELDDEDKELKNGYESADTALSNRITTLESTIDGGEID